MKEKQEQQQLLQYHQQQKFYTSIDPTNPHEVLKLKNTKWLPPLSDTARALLPSSIQGVSYGLKRPAKLEVKAQPQNDKGTATLGNHSNVEGYSSMKTLTKGRFPAVELRNCYQVTKNLRSNENRRFLTDIKEQALRMESKKMMQEDEFQKAKLRSQSTIAWDMINSLCKDPKFAKTIEDLAALGSHSTVDFLPSISNHNISRSNSIDAMGRKSNITKISQADDKGNQKKNPATSPITTQHDSSNPNDQTSIQATSEPLQSSDSFLDLRQKIETSVFRPKKKGERNLPDINLQMNLQNEEYKYGKPTDMREGELEEYNLTFKDLSNIGEHVGQTLRASEKDKRNFSASHHRSGGIKTVVRKKSLLYTTAQTNAAIAAERKVSLTS